MRSRLLAVLWLVGCGLAGCVSDDPVDLTAAVLRISIDTCAPGNEDRATAVSIGDGLALTVAHSFDDAAAISLIEADDNEVEAELVYLDRDRDIALLAFETAAVSPDTQQGLRIHSDADAPADRARIVVHRDGSAIVRPIELLRRTIVTLDTEGRRDGIELGAEIEPGDSGAPVVDDDDRIIGLVFAASRAGDTGWAIAGSELLTVRDEAGGPLPLAC